MVTKPATANPKKGNACSPMKARPPEMPKNAPKGRAAESRVPRPHPAAATAAQDKARAHDHQGRDERKQTAVRTGIPNNAECPR